MNLTEMLSYIHSLGNFSLSPGLERMHAVMEQLGNPQDAYPVIHIAGTNGKGSVSAMLAGIYHAAGLKTGLYISPFILDFRERIQINNTFISPQDLCFYGEKVMQTGISLTEFEFITATAFLYYKAQGIDLLVCETGLGGRLDATNVIGQAVCNVITKVGLDHTKILGDTLEKITAEKCGILRNCPTVTSPFQPPEVIKELRRFDPHPVIPDKEQFRLLSSDLTGNRFLYKDREYVVPLAGEFQAENALIVLETVKHSGYAIPYETVLSGLSSVVFPARMEILSRKPLILLDGAHNPDGAAVLAKELRKLAPVTAVIAAMRDKNVEKVLDITLPFCKTVIATTVPGMSRALSPQELAAKVGDRAECLMAENPSRAVAMLPTCKKSRPVAIFGSLYLASAIRPLLLP